MVFVLAELAVLVGLLMVVGVGGPVFGSVKNLITFSVHSFLTSFLYSFILFGFLQGKFLLLFPSSFAFAFAFVLGSWSINGIS